MQKSHAKALQVADLLKKAYAKKDTIGSKQHTAHKTHNDEMLDILDENGNSVNTLKKRSQVHKHGLWHRTVHVWIVTSKHEILIQKRANRKLTYPDMWDVSCAGHVESGSTSRSSALREAKEELGITLSPLELKKIGRLKQTYDKGDIHDNEIVDIFLVQRDITIESCRLQKDEVSQIRLIRLADLKRCVKNHDAQLVPHPNEYALLFQVLEERE